MTDARGDRPSRRSVLAGGCLLLLAACTGSSPVGPPPPTADQRLVRRVVAEISVLGTAYAATIAAHPRTRGLLAPLAAEHAAHVTALVALLPAPTSTPTQKSSASPTPSPVTTIAPSPGTARANLAAAETAAAARRRGQAGRAGPELARLLASIAACESVHAMLVGP